VCGDCSALSPRRGAEMIGACGSAAIGDGPMNLLVNVGNDPYVVARDISASVKSPCASAKGIAARCSRSGMYLGATRIKKRCSGGHFRRSLGIEIGLSLKWFEGQFAVLRIGGCCEVHSDHT
jgi:hypothetical protein